MNLKTVIFMGRSGSGKGTQAKLLVNELIKSGVGEADVLNISTGDLFRAFANEGGYTQDKVQLGISAGERLPDFLAVSLWGNFFIKTYRPNRHLFLDGTPRSHAEARMLENALRFYERHPIDVLNIKVSNEWSISHLMSRGRGDDQSVGVIKQRLAFYEDDVVDAIDYYRGSPHVRFHEVIGERTIEEVHQDVVKAVLN